jgi:hypothetical protein
MDDEAHYQRLVEVAALAQQHSIAASLACAVRSLYSVDHPRADRRAERAAAAAAAVAVEALVDWRVRHKTS